MPEPARRSAVFALTALGAFMAALDLSIVNVAFPDLERDFAEASRAELSWVLNAYNILFAALLVPAGRVADIVGRRRMFFVGIGTFLVASALCGVAGSVEMLVAGASNLPNVGCSLTRPRMWRLPGPRDPLATDRELLHPQHEERPG